MTNFSMIFAAMMCVLVFVAPHAEGLSCSAVTKSLSPCENYLKQGGSVPSGCCSGARSLNAMAKSTPDRQDACRCIKTAAKAIGANPKYAAAVPKQCNVNVGYAISVDIDCNTVR